MTYPPPGQWPPPPGSPYPPAGLPPGPAPAGLGPGSPYPIPPQQQRTNPFAIIALVLGIIGGVVLGAVFGFIALAQIRRSGERGSGLAIAGIITSGFWTLLLVVGIILGVAHSTPRSGTSTSVESVAVGDCITELPDGVNVRTVRATPCGQPHRGEVFATYDATGGTYPGQDPLQDDAERRCTDLLDGYAPGAGDGLGLYTLVPTDRGWGQGDRTVQCVAVTDAPRTGSIRTR